jgi:TRAP transporter TAXI family solute receptor
MKRVWQSTKDLSGTYGIATALFVGCLFVAYQFVDPAPPREIVLATGEDGGAYQTYGAQYADILGRNGISVELKTTAGSVENLDLLAAETGVHLAFVQSGLAESYATSSVMALGSLYFEPLWLFVRDELQINHLGDLAGARVTVGAEGSGTRAVGMSLLAANGVDASNTRLLDLSHVDAINALATAEVDAAIVIASPDSDVVRQMIRLPGIHLYNFDRGGAYARLYPFLSRVSLPEGVMDLSANLPATDVITIAPTAMLVAREDLHPALVDLLLIAALEIHGRSSLLSDPGQFPTAQYADVPISEEAKRFYRYGPPFLQRILPFWAATLVDRLKIMLLPLLALAIPLAKLLPPLYRWRIRSRFLRLYDEVQRLDPDHADSPEDTDVKRNLQELDRIDHMVTKITVPRSYMGDLYKLRRDIDLVRRRLRSVGLQHQETGSATGYGDMGP